MQIEKTKMQKYGSIHTNIGKRKYLSNFCSSGLPFSQFLYQISDMLRNIDYSINVAGEIINRKYLKKPAADLQSLIDYFDFNRRSSIHNYFSELSLSHILGDITLGEYQKQQESIALEYMLIDYLSFVYNVDPDSIVIVGGKK